MIGRVPVTPTLNADLVVVGGGMGGMTAAASAAAAGGRVVVLDKAPELGGSAAMSGGFVWTAPTFDDLRSEDPAADEVLGRLLVDDYAAGIEWLRGLGVPLSAEVTGIYGFGRGYQADIGAYLETCRSIVESHGGRVVAPACVHELLRQNGRVVGVRASDPHERSLRIDSPWTLLATGGFQGDPELRAAHIHPNARAMLLRSNPYSAGDGLRLGLSAGGTSSPDMAGFYGHLVPSPLSEFRPEQFIPLAQLHSAHCVLVDDRGLRFADESLGDHFNVAAVLALPGARAILVADEHIRQTHVLAAYIHGMEQLDRLRVAADAGARFAEADSLEELAAEAAPWGIDPDRMLRTLVEYSERAAAGGSALVPPRSRHAEPLATPPFFALEVQPAITFTYGSLRVGASGRVLGRAGPVAGLLAAGVDAGGVFHRGYAGGLARGLVFGRRAARTATESDPGI
jgi:succinate dehydrogenase/fumarate reductase flavoprotein subunit